MFRNPGVREHRLADTRGAAENDVRRILDLRSQKGDRVLLPEHGVHCVSDKDQGVARHSVSVRSLGLNRSI